ncbi:hypothetical protein MRB53_003066 [Persea americana]|uniref:Uncharacterized protein n=1 Tax=Persea americana TaxID=3435 RepID=A0ACC2MX11_PERAE|nr:hypothetical protein MRB53_003066 [Persea americana]
MARRLQKKVEKLESDLTKLINEEPTVEKETALRYHQRLVFLKNLLLAEKESHHSIPQYLHHIEQKMVFLETAFLDWLSFHSSTPPHHLQTVHTCSCTHDCFKEEGESSDPSSQVDDNLDPEPVFGEDLEETRSRSGEGFEETVPKIPTVMLTETPTVAGDVVGERKRREEGKALACRKSVVVGVALFAVALGMMAASFSGGLNYHSTSLTPT